MNLDSNLFFTEIDFCMPDVIQGLLLHFGLCLETFFNGAYPFFSLLLDQQSFRIESGLGVADYRACSEASTNITCNRLKNYRKEKPLSESNVRRFSKPYNEEISKAQKNNRGVNRNLSVLPRRRPLLLGSLNQMVQRFLLSLQRTGGLVSCAIAISAAKALIARNPQYNLIHIDLDSSHWVQSLFQRMDFKKRMQTTGKVEILEGARKEAELLYLLNIVTIVEKYEILHSLIMNWTKLP